MLPAANIAKYFDASQKTAGFFGRFFGNHLRVVASLLVLGSALTTRAEVRPHPLFSDHAVLQQGVEVPVWGSADSGEKVTVRFAGQEVSTTAADGKWMVKLAKLQAGGPHDLVIEGPKNSVTLRDVLVGEVWVASGQSNMQWGVAASADPERVRAEAKNPYLRLITVPREGSPEPRTTLDATWQECNGDTVRDFSAVAYHFGRHLQLHLSVPVGLINTSYGGTPAEAWTPREDLLAVAELKPLVERNDADVARLPAEQKRYEEALAAWEKAAKAAKDAGQAEPQRPQPPAAVDHPHRPCVLYNAMIHPLLPYAIKGAIWYQGESNAGRAYEYRTLFPNMISSWRRVWGGQEFPFLFVQLAPFMKIVQEPGDSAWAELREAQLHATQVLPKTAMAVITDVGDENDIHPVKKEPVGARLALAARAIAYREAIEYSGPAYERAHAEGSKLVLDFSHVGQGLEARGGELQGFALCGPDHKFVNAQARIEGNSVIVEAAGISEPVAARYGWANYPLGNLWNKDGLPASPFRTDDFGWTTKP